MVFSRRRHIFLMFACFFIMMQFCSFTSYAASDGMHRKVKVGYYILNNFQEYNESTQQYRGYSYDYMLALAQYAGWDYDFVPVTYDEGVQKLASGELDLMNNVEKTAELTSTLNFSSVPSGESYTCLVVNPDNAAVSYEDYKGISDLTVGLNFASTQNIGFINYCKDNDCMPHFVYYRTQDEVETALKDKKVDACIVSSLRDINMRTVAKFDTHSYYFAVTKENSELLKELSTAMNKLKTNDPYFEEKLYSKYHASSVGQETVLSEEEKKYIASAPTVNVSYDPDWYPISYSDKSGKFCGAVADIFKMISERTGLKFKFDSAKTYTDAVKRFAAGKTQIMASFPYDYTWAAAHNADITNPFMTLSEFRAYKTGTEDKNKILAVRDGCYQQFENDISHSIDYAYRKYETIGDCLEAVIDGDADSVLLDSYQMEYYREKASYRKLSYKSVPGFDYRLSAAVSKNADPQLLSIMNKTIASLGTDKISEALKDSSMMSSSRTMLDLFYSNPGAAGMIFGVIGFLLAVVISVLFVMYFSKKKNQKLAEAINARSEFMSNISHDMRTPLNGIIGYTNLAIASDDTEQVNDYLIKVKTSGELMLNLINDTLDISKIESGKYTLISEEIDSGELLDSILVPIKSMAEAKKINFVVDSEHFTAGHIITDKVNTQKIFLNLMSNAVKFTPEGGTVKFMAEDIDPLKNNNYNLKVTVKDSGIGIGDEFLPSIYEPFSQEKSEKARNSGGTGLGLSIVKSIVDLMHGKILVQSKKGEGTEFTLYFRVKKLEAKNETEKKTGFVTDKLRGKKILVCEDNEMNMEITRTILENEGIKTEGAANGKEGLDLFASSAENEFTAILMDLRMPEMDGYETTEKIRALDRDDAKKIPIIALSADAYAEDIKKCMNIGMNGHVSKPIDSGELLRELAHLCK